MSDVKRVRGSEVPNFDSAHNYWVLASDYDAAIALLHETEDRLGAELAEAKRIIERDKSSASHRLHNLCDGISEQADESPFTREEWDRVDKETARVTNENRALRAALERIAELTALDNGEHDRIYDRVTHVHDIAREALRGTERTADQPTAARCKHGILAPWACDECEQESWEAHKRATDQTKEWQPK